MKAAIARVPATTANLGPGFDALGVALKLYNKVRVAQETKVVGERDPFIEEIGETFFKASRKKVFPYSVQISGDVPQSRGLGSSVTVRLGVLLALNHVAGSPLGREKILDLCTALEGHPDNATPATVGGFVACGGCGYFRAIVSSKLAFIAAIPSKPLRTREARDVLPAKVPLPDVVKNLQRVGVIVGAFATKNYALLKDNMGDTIHQPVRGPLIRGFKDVLVAAREAGALEAYLSGAGSTIMALATSHETKIAEAMHVALLRAGDPKPSVRILHADNQGAHVIAG